MPGLKGGPNISTDGLATEAKQDDIIDAVNNITLTPTNGSIVYGEVAAVPDSSETTLVTYTVPLLSDFSLDKAHGSGEGDGLFRLKKNGNTIAKRRSNWTERNVHFEYGSLLFAAGDVITVTVYHEEGVNKEFSAELYGS